VKTGLTAPASIIFGMLSPKAEINRAQAKKDRS
jgi:hypothetical protein